jgi:hypothetical protein
LKLEPRHEQPLRILRELQQEVPKCWEQVDFLREDKDTWPPWCYLPIAAAIAIVTHGATADELLADAVLRNRADNLGTTLAALAAWRVTQGVWDFDPELYQALWETPMEGKLPVELLFRLPEWAPYICLRGATVGGSPIAGVFVRLEPAGGADPPELRLALVPEAEPAPLLHLSLHLDGATVGECLGHAADLAVRCAAPYLPLQDLAEMRSAWQQQLPLVQHILSLVLYLCSGEPDLTRRLPPAPATYRKRVLRAPSQVTVWPVGLRIGAALRAAARSQASGSDASAGSSVRPHIRRAHWHCYWTGTRTHERPGERLELRWIAPVPVGAGEVVTTVRPVHER